MHKGKTNLRKIFGKLKHWKIDSQKFKNERRKEDAERDELLSHIGKD